MTRILFGVEMNQWEYVPKRDEEVIEDGNEGRDLTDI